MLTVWKYPVREDDQFMLKMPKGAQVLTVQTQGGSPHLWALIDPDAPIVEHWFRLAGTGHAIDAPSEKLRYIGSFQMYSGQLVFHLFEIVG